MLLSHTNVSDKGWLEHLSWDHCNWSSFHKNPQLFQSHMPITCISRYRFKVQNMYFEIGIHYQNLQFPPITPMNHVLLFFSAAHWRWLFTESPKGCKLWTISTIWSEQSSSLCPFFTLSVGFESNAPPLGPICCGLRGGRGVFFFRRATHGGLHKFFSFSSFFTLSVGFESNAPPLGPICCGLRGGRGVFFFRRATHGGMHKLFSFYSYLSCFFPPHKQIRYKLFHVLLELSWMTARALYSFDHLIWAIFFSLSSSWYQNVFCLGLSILFNKPLQCWRWSRLSGDSPCEPIFSSKLYCQSWNFVLHFVVPIVCIAQSRFEAPFQGADYMFRDWCSLPRFPHFLGLLR